MDNLKLWWREGRGAIVSLAIALALNYLGIRLMEHDPSGGTLLMLSGSMCFTLGTYVMLFQAMPRIRSNYDDRIGRLFYGFIRLQVWAAMLIFVAADVFLAYLVICGK